MKLRLLPLLLFIGAVGILWLLSARRADGAEYSVHCSDGILYCVVQDRQKNVAHASTTKEIADDWAEALNEAHKRRHQHKINVTCKEISHTFMDCENIESDDHGSGLRPEK